MSSHFTLSCVLSIFSNAPSNLNIHPIEFSYKEREYPKELKTSQYAKKQQCKGGAEVGLKFSSDSQES